MLALRQQEKVRMLLVPIFGSFIKTTTRHKNIWGFQIGTTIWESDSGLTRASSGTF
jgi:hypothetical protein